MGKPKTDDDTPSETAACHFCGRSLSPTAPFCAECNRYQPGPRRSEPGEKASGGLDAPEPETKACRTCGELIPRIAERCNHCKGFQRGLRRWLPVSAATVSALGALVATTILLLEFALDRPPAPRSATELRILGADESGLSLAVSNRGNRSSLVGSGWVRFAETCTWDTTPCREQGATVRPEPAPDTIEIEAAAEDALADPGIGVVYFDRNYRGIDPDHYPEGLDRQNCRNFDEVALELDLCVAFEVLEHDASDYRCEETSAPAARYERFIKAALGCPPGGTG